MKTTEFWNYAREKDFIFAHSIFLEDFYHLPNRAQKIEAIIDEPDSEISVEDEFFTISEMRASIASMAHHLAVENNLPVPEWVFDKKYFLPEPIFQFHTENPDYQEYLKKKVFPEYRMRNLFYDDNTLVRF